MLSENILKLIAQAGPLVLSFGLVFFILRAEYLDHQDTKKTSHKNS